MVTAWALQATPNLPRISRGKVMKYLGNSLLFLFALVAGVSSADALVLCANASGSVVALAACKPGMTQLDPAALGLVGPAGAQGPAGPAGPRGPSNGLAADNFSSGLVPVPVSTSGGAPTMVLALALPTGNFLVQAAIGLHADIALGTLNPFANVQCSFADGAGPFGATIRTQVGGSTDNSASIPLLAAVSLAAPDTVTVACFNDNAGIAVVTGESAVTAIQVGTLTGP
jgi:hypothetical protein